MAAGAIGVNTTALHFGHLGELFILTHSDPMDRIDEESQTPAPPVTFTGRKTLVAAAVAVVLIAGALLIRPARTADDARPPEPGERAASAVGMGAPAAAVDLTALVADREKWLAAHPDDDASWAVLGSAYLEHARRTADSGWFPKAEKALKRSLEVRPAEKGNFDAMTGMGALANARRDFGTARKWGELVRAQAPKRWTAYPVLVDAYTGLGDYKGAQKAMELLLDMRPGLAAYVRASQVYRDRGWREDAVVAMEHAAGAAKTPAEKAYALFRLGSCPGSGATRARRCGSTRARCARIRRRRRPSAGGPARWPRWVAAARRYGTTGWRWAGPRCRSWRGSSASCWTRWGGGRRRAPSTTRWPR